MDLLIGAYGTDDDDDNNSTTGVDAHAAAPPSKRLRSDGVHAHPHYSSLPLAPRTLRGSPPHHSLPLIAPPSDLPGRYISKRERALLTTASLTASDHLRLSFVSSTETPGISVWKFGFNRYAVDVA